MFFSVVIAIIVALIIYLVIGFSLSSRNTTVLDMFPLSRKGKAKVNSSTEFSGSTIATTISLATVILTFYELASYFGFWWLLFPVITTSIGIYIVRVLSPRIWQKMNGYENRPSIHEFLATEYNSPKLAFIGGIVTSLSFLGAFAVELSVGSRFIAALLPEIPNGISILILASISFIYTFKGGFRAVIVTDKIQMLTIWTLLLLLTSYYVYSFSTTNILENLPSSILSIEWRDGLFAFLIGIFILNVPAYLSDFGLWMRISASKSIKTVKSGLWSSVIGSFVSWFLIVFLACFVFAFIVPVENVNPLFTFIQYLGQLGLLERILIFIITLGLFGAMLSTASTQLIVVAHSLYEDVLFKKTRKNLNVRAKSKKETGKSKIILITTAVTGVLIVELFRYLDFSIADLMFAIYGSQLGLFVPLLISLFSNTSKTQSLSQYGKYAIIIGFVSGWTAAIIGRASGNDNLVFLSPLFSIGLSGIIMFIGLIRNSKRNV